MEANISMYRDLSETAIVYHNKNGLPSINIPHLHSQYEIYYNISGADGFFFNKKYYSCVGNDLFVVPRACVHKALIGTNTFYERCVISIDSKTINSINNIPPVMGALDWLEDVGEAVAGKAVLNERQHGIFMNMVYKYNNAADELHKLSVLVEMLSIVSRLFKNAAPVSADVPKEEYGRALLIIEEDFRDIKISDIAKRLYLSSSAFNNLFTERSGITPKEYLLLRKIAEAKKHLHMGASVKEASNLSGFSDCSNFIRAFKKYEGCSPGKLEFLSQPI